MQTGEVQGKYQLRHTLVGHRAAVSSVQFSPDGRWLASSSASRDILVHSTSNFALAKTLHDHTAGVSHVAFSPNSRFLASASEDRTVRVWDLADESAEIMSSRTMRGHLSAVFCVSWSPRGDLIASGGMDETVRLWTVQGEDCLRVLPAHSDPVSAVSFTSDGSVLVTCSWDGYIRIWDTATGQCLKTLADDDNTPISSIRFSPNGRYLFTSALDSTIRLWDHQNDKTLKTYFGHVNRKYCIPSTLDSDGWHIISGSEDNIIYVWNLQTREIVDRLEGHKDVVVAVATHPRKAMIASGALDKDPTVRIWVRDILDFPEEPAERNNNVASDA